MKLDKFLKGATPIARKQEVSQVESYRLQLESLCPGVSNTWLSLMAYLKFYGADNYAQKATDHEITISLASAKAVECSLRSEGYITGYKSEITLNEKLKLRDGPLIILERVDIDTTHETINHNKYRRNDI